MNFRFEVTVIPVSDVDRAKAFYQGLGWRLDADFPINDNLRIVQLTPPGSPASIQFGTGLSAQEPGSLRDLMLIVDDVEAARKELQSLGAEVGEVWHGLRGLDTSQRVPGLAPDRGSYGSYAEFSDPDGNVWLLQEITQRLPNRE
ncbi:VOC family protein [Actinoplanes sp. NPDC049596]|uniref:VOC family protein n=1 Tax=unclassified Actinoplanes TaxID=2626549 RepID=UPI0034225213